MKYIKPAFSWIALVLLVLCLIGLAVAFSRNPGFEAVPLGVLALVVLAMNTWNQPGR